MDLSQPPSDSSVQAGGIALVIILLPVLLIAGFWLRTLVDAAKRPDSEWRSADQSKVLWVLLIVFLGALGSILYLVIPRPTLRRSQTAGTA